MRIFLLSAFLCLFAAPALAQSESQLFDYGFGFENEAKKTNEFLKRQSMRERGEVTPTTINVNLIREAYMDDDQFALALTVPDAVSGCYQFSPLQYEASFIDPYYLDLKVGGYQVKVIESQNPHLDCPVGYKMARTVIPMSVSDLKQRGTKQLKLRTDNVTEYYDLSINGSVISLQPQSMITFKAPVHPETNMLSLDMNDSKRLRLYVPMARAGEDMHQALVDFASQRGLSVDTVSSPLKTNPVRHSVVVTDVNGLLTSQVKGGDVQEVGQVSVLRPVQTPSGIQDAKVPLKVFASSL